MTDALMAPRPPNPSKHTSITSISDELFQAVQECAENRGITLRELYDEAVGALVAKVERGEVTAFHPTMPWSVTGLVFKPRRVRLTPAIFDAMVETCKTQRVHQSVFFLRALRDYLSDKGIDAPE